MIMRTVISYFFILLLLEQCSGQIIDIGGTWETKCPQGCSCEVQKFTDLPVHRWVNAQKYSQKPLQEDGNFNSDFTDHPQANELLKVATCIISENPTSLLSQLPTDIQVFTILESAGYRDSEIQLDATVFDRFEELTSLDIQGIDYDDSSAKILKSETKNIVLSADALFSLKETLLYLNLERVKLTSLSLINKNKANLVVKPMNSPKDDKVNEEYVPPANGSRNMGHRLIFLSQQNNGDSDDKEILPYDIYKQEMEGYRGNAGLFTGLGALTHLRVYDCALKDISWHMFDGLDSLLHLSLEKNNLKVIPEFCFYGTPNLRSLSLASNQLLTLNSVDLAGLLILEELDLKGNNLTFLSELSFPPFPALKVANFRDNPLDTVFPSTFEIMNTTIELYLGGSESRLKLQKNSLLGLQQLEILHLYNLDIPVLERFILQGMPMLSTLKMRGNITSIDFDAFVDLSNLRDLDMNSCHIQRISMDAFYGLDKVRRIDLSNNELEFIPPGLFSIQQQKELKEIILTKNKLTTLPWDFFKNLRLPNKQTQMLSVRLDENPWDCTCSMATWYSTLVNRVKETAPRCSTPKRLRNWGIFHALRKGGLQCKKLKRRYATKFSKASMLEDNNIIS